MIVNNLLGKYNEKEQGGVPPALNTKEDLQQQAQSSPVIDAPTAKDVKVDNQQVQPIVTPEVKYPNKPQGVSNSDYEHLTRFGYTPDRISSLMAHYAPSSNEGYLSRVYQSSVPRATAPNKKEIKNARLISSIGDGLGLLSQMWSAGRGAHVSPRDYSQSALAKTEGQVKEMENRYLQLSQRYNDGMFNARLKDFAQGLDDHRSGKKGLQSVMAQKQALDQKANELEQKQSNWMQEQAPKKDKDNVAAEQKKEDLDLKRKNNESLDAYRKRMASASESRVKSMSERNNAYINHYSKNEAKSVKSIPLYFKDGTEIEVPENVWKANYPVLVDILTEQGVATPREWRRKSPSPTQVEYFIKQNKDNLPQKAMTWLEEISQQKGTEYDPQIEEIEEDESDLDIFQVSF